MSDDDVAGFWLSFSDAKRFLGGAIVPGATPMEAHVNATVYGCNPGGEILFQPIPRFAYREIGIEWRCRLLPREECDALGRVLVRIFRKAAS